VAWTQGTGNWGAGDTGLVGPLSSLDELLTLGVCSVGTWGWWRLPCFVVVPNASFVNIFIEVL